MKSTLLLFAVMATVLNARSLSPRESKNNAEGKFISALMLGAKATSNSQLRKMDQEYQVDISTYSIKFEKCQFVKPYDGDIAADEDMDTVLNTKQFVVFRLCPDNSCNNCDYNYGEYLVDLETYLEATIEYQQEAQEQMCDACDENCNFDDDASNNGIDNVYCDNCYNECTKIENMEVNGYVDATGFRECQLIYDPGNSDKSALYAGPMCDDNGHKIKISIFTDEYCDVVDASKNVDNYLLNDDGYRMKLSHALLKTVYWDRSCISCGQNGNGDDEGNEANELCETLYKESAKCEKTHGFDDGYANANRYKNQLEQEEVVCDFIDSIKAGIYDESGEIFVKGGTGSNGGSTTTTSGQKCALTFLILGTVGLAVYAATLYSKRKHQWSKVSTEAPTQDEIGMTMMKPETVD